VNYLTTFQEIIKTKQEMEVTRLEKPNLRRIHAKDAPPPAGTYSQGIVAGGFLFLAGQAPLNSDGKKVPGTFREELERTLGNLETVAQTAGTSLDQAVRLGVYLLDMNNFAEMNLILAAWLHEPYPVRTTIQADLRGFQVEIDAIIKMPVNHT